jgi:hypothetical protein
MLCPILMHLEQQGTWDVSKTLGTPGDTGRGSIGPHRRPSTRGDGQLGSAVPVRSSRDLEATVRPLLHGMLRGLDRFRQTPLNLEIDCIGIVSSSIQMFAPGSPLRDAGVLEGGHGLIPALNAIFVGALRDDLPPEETRSSPVSYPPAASEDEHHFDTGQSDRHDGVDVIPLAQWLEQAYRTMRAVDTRAIEIVRLRVEGYTHREIAQRLDLGLRMVLRMMADVRQAWLDGHGT